jgi:hypothetical protein
MEFHSRLEKEWFCKAGDCLPSVGTLEFTTRESIDLNSNETPSSMRIPGNNESGALLDRLSHQRELTRSAPSPPPNGKKMVSVAFKWSPSDSEFLTVFPQYF